MINEKIQLSQNEELTQVCGGAQASECLRGYAEGLLAPITAPIKGLMHPDLRGRGPWVGIITGEILLMAIAAGITYAITSTIYKKIKNATSK